MTGKTYEPMTKAAAELEAPAVDAETHAEGFNQHCIGRRVLLGCVAAAGMLACAPLLTHRLGAAHSRPSGHQSGFVSKAGEAGEADDLVHARTVWIKSKQNKGMCLKVAGGLNKNGNVAQLDFCDPEDKDFQLLVPKSGKGFIRWSTHPEKCLLSPDGELMWWDCEDEKREHQTFRLTKGTQGTIELAGSATCITVPVGGADTTTFLEMGDCKAESSQLIVEDVPGVCAYARWSEWSMCTDKCGGGVAARSRSVLTQQESDDGSECTERFETRRCNAQKCQPPLAV